MELLEAQKHGIDELDALGDMMTEMLDRQIDIEVMLYGNENMIHKADIHPDEGRNPVTRLIRLFIKS